MKVWDSLVFFFFFFVMLSDSNNLCELCFYSVKTKSVKNSHLWVITAKQFCNSININVSNFLKLR